jgi:hypothetical protein
MRKVVIKILERLYLIACALTLLGFVWYASA